MQRFMAPEEILYDKAMLNKVWLSVPQMEGPSTTDNNHDDEEGDVEHDCGLISKMTTMRKVVRRQKGVE